MNDLEDTILALRVWDKMGRGESHMLLYRLEKLLDVKILPREHWEHMCGVPNTKADIEATR